ncbi:MAG: DUF1810 domain-containing protein [Pseudomonadota bacterium]
MNERGEADPFDLARFLSAQAGVIERAIDELKAGRKRSHWMWFVFPQLAGLGASAMAQRYAIGSLAEARAYLAHETLGPRLEQSVAATSPHRERGASALFGSPDDLKFRSCLTLFRAASPDGALFQEALDAYFGGEGDPASLEILKRAAADTR